MPAHPTYLTYVLKLSSHLRLCLPSVLLPSGFPTKTLRTLLFPVQFLRNQLRFSSMEKSL